MSRGTSFRKVKNGKGEMDEEKTATVKCRPINLSSDRSPFLPNGSAQFPSNIDFPTLKIVCPLVYYPEIFSFTVRYLPSTVPYLHYSGH